MVCTCTEMSVSLVHITLPTCTFMAQVGTLSHVILGIYMGVLLSVYRCDTGCNRQADRGGGGDSQST